MLFSALNLWRTRAPGKKRTKLRGAKAEEDVCELPTHSLPNTSSRAWPLGIKGCQQSSTMPNFIFTSLWDYRQGDLDEAYHHLMSKLHLDLAQQSPKASLEKGFFNLNPRLSASGKSLYLHSPVKSPALKFELYILPTTPMGLVFAFAWGLWGFFGLFFPFGCLGFFCFSF